MNDSSCVGEILDDRRETPSDGSGRSRPRCVRAMAAPSANPYQPGRGVAPPVLAGRDAELHAAEGFLDQLEARRMPSRDVLFYGPRGNGKTTLLLEVARRAGRRGLRVETLPVDALSDRPALLRELQERAGRLHSRLTGPNDGRLANAGEPAPPTENASRLLLDWIRREAVPLVVLLDEIQALEIGAGAAFFNALQAARAGSYPFLLICAGTPDGPRQLRRAATHNERGFRRLRVGRLDREASLTALSEPASQAGLPMDSDAACFLAEEAQDYPYFIQLLAAPPAARSRSVVPPLAQRCRRIVRAQRCKRTRTNRQGDAHQMPPTRWPPLVAVRDQWCDTRR